MACSETVQLFASVGVIAVYLACGALVSWLIYELTRENESSVDDTLIIIGGIFWPLALAVLVILFIGRVAVNLIYGATIFDLRRTEGRLGDRIDNVARGRTIICPSSYVDSSGYSDNDTPLDIGYSDNSEQCKPTFKVGDIVTGADNQTDIEGNPAGYEHLYQGCKCRVISVNNKGSMDLILLDHIDKEAHRSSIGKKFTAPVRNFVLLKVRNKAKNKAVKRSVRKAVRRTSKNKARR